MGLDDWATKRITLKSDRGWATFLVVSREGNPELQSLIGRVGLLVR